MSTRRKDAAARNFEVLRLAGLPGEPREHLTKGDHAVVCSVASDPASEDPGAGENIRQQAAGAFTGLPSVLVERRPEFVDAPAVEVCRCRLEHALDVSSLDTEGC